MLSTVVRITSTYSQLIIISRLNRFTFVTALLLPVLRLGLMLPAHPQGLGTGGRLLLTRQACPAVMLSAYKDRSRSQWKTVYAVFTARTYFQLYHNIIDVSCQ